MCVDPVTAGMVLSVAGTGMQMVAQNRARKRTDSAIVDAIGGQRRRQTQAIEAMQPAIEQYDPRQRAQAVDEQRGQIEQGYESMLERTNALALPDAPIGGNVSESYLDRRAEGALREGERTRRIAQLMSKTQAPSSVQRNEDLQLADSASRVGQQQNFGAGDAAVDQIEIRQAGGVNPWLYGAGSLAQAGGTLYGMYGGAPTGGQPATQVYRGHPSGGRA